MMGFKFDVAEFGAQMVGDRNLEEALGYLTDKDENDKYVHEFVPFKQDGLCFLCQEPDYQHIIEDETPFDQ